MQSNYYFSLEVNRDIGLNSSKNSLFNAFHKNFDLNVYIFFILIWNGLSSLSPFCEMLHYILFRVSEYNTGHYTTYFYSKQLYFSEFSYQPY